MAGKSVPKRVKLKKRDAMAPEQTNIGWIVLLLLAAAAAAGTVFLFGDGIKGLFH